jgi:threonine/homoserine/homoserine lactone efflux protein
MVPGPLPPELFLALVGFAAVMAGTPGPNNVMVVASGLNFGFRRTLPHMLGIAIGFGAMNTLVGLGFGEIFRRFPVIYTAMKFIGAAYLLWLAWAIARSGPVKEGEVRGQPLSFVQGALFQWVNPKAWVIAVGAIAAYSQPEHYVASVLTIGAVMTIVTMPCVMVWSAFGASLKVLLRNPGTVRTFNLVMALLLVASLWPILAEMIPK